jgi:hypothetical protein
MNAADIELARMIYIASSLAIILFTSMILRGLWRPLRFVLLAFTISILFTPFFVEQAMPDGSNQNIVPAFVVMAHNGVSDREHWQEAIQLAGKPIVVVGGIAGTLALLLALILPKPKKKPSQKKPDQQKPSPQTLSEQKSEPPALALKTSIEKPISETKISAEKKPSPNKQKPKKYKKKKKNPYLPDDFQPE